MKFTFKNLRKLNDAFQNMTFSEFSTILYESIGANEDYARGVWINFQNHPLAYIYSRSPICQGEALFNWARNKIPYFHTHD